MSGTFLVHDGESALVNGALNALGLLKVVEVEEELVELEEAAFEVFHRDNAIFVEIKS